MQKDVMDLDLSFKTEGETLFTDAASPLGEARGSSTRPHREEFALSDRSLGELVFHRMLPGAVRALYHRCRGRLSAGGTLRLRVRADAHAGTLDVVRIHAIPWELACDPHGDGFLALDPQVQLVRYVNIATAVPDALQLGTRDLEVLIAIASPSELQRLHWEAECDDIQRAFAGSAVRITVLRRATRSRLLESLASQRHQVLHVIGHGSAPTARCAGKLALETETGDSDWITARELATIARSTPALRLVFLNACSTAELAFASQRNLAAAVGPSLALRGVPAVVAMANTIDDDDAIRFARSVYSRLSDGATLEAAVHTGRIAMQLGRSRSWAIPVVFNRAAAHRTAEQSSRVEPPHHSTVTQAAEIRGQQVEIAAWFREPGAASYGGADHAKVVVEADRIIGTTVTIGGIVDRGRGDGRTR